MSWSKKMQEIIFKCFMPFDQFELISNQLYHDFFCFLFNLCDVHGHPKTGHGYFIGLYPPPPIFLYESGNCTLLICSIYKRACLTP